MSTHESHNIHPQKTAPGPAKTGQEKKAQEHSKDAQDKDRQTNEGGSQPRRK